MRAAAFARPEPLSGPGRARSYSVDRQFDCGCVLIGARGARDDDGVAARRSSSASVNAERAHATASRLEQTAAYQQEHQAVAQQLSALRLGHPQRAQEYGWQ